jgi:hypothetical protein
MKENDAAMEKHERAKLEFDTLKALKKPVGRAPRIPKMQSACFQCHCHQMHCLRGGGGTCPDCENNTETDTAMEAVPNVAALVLPHTWQVWHAVCVWDRLCHSDLFFPNSRAATL